MVFSHCISNVSSAGLQFSRIAARSLSPFTHQLLQHSIHPFLLICVHFPIQLLGLPLHCLFHVYLVLQLLVGLLFCFLVQLPLLFRIKTLPMILVCLVMVEQVLYDFVDWEQIFVLRIQGVHCQKASRKLQDAQVNLETQNISGSQQAQLKSYSSFHTHFFSIFFEKSNIKNSGWIF